MAPAAQKILLGDLPLAATSPQATVPTTPYCAMLCRAMLTISPGHVHYESPFQTVDMGMLTSCISHFSTSLNQHLCRFLHPSLFPAVLSIACSVVVWTCALLACAAVLRLILQGRSRGDQCVNDDDDDDDDDDVGEKRASWRLVRRGCVSLAGEEEVRKFEMEEEGRVGMEVSKDEPLEHLPGHLRI
ncbi:hypothetical protein VMCG_08432 [Cytospora schulzeri]|uniref:Uncharacterized protein n=1 Tax=Cytospora schulzeri TaxID=448051 RepID=A0A423VQR2_9PEZI|nr:hypothetical protein VMCG_08432 [Valsa malicola]